MRRVLDTPISLSQSLDDSWALALGLGMTGSEPYPSRADAAVEKILKVLRYDDWVGSPEQWMALKQFRNRYALENPIKDVQTY